MNSGEIHDLTSKPCLNDCWAKTNASGEPALTVQDHCMIVGAVAECVSLLLPRKCHELLPKGAITLTAAHDIGKITPGFLRKCRKSFFATLPGGQDCESNHALVSQAFLSSLPELQDERSIPFAWNLCAGGHHGCYPTSKAHNNLGKRRGPNENGLAWPDQLRRELLDELIKHFGPLPTATANLRSQVHWLTGFTTFCDWIGSNTDWFPLPPSPPLQNQITIDSARKKAAAALERIGWHRRSILPNLTFQKLFSNPAQSCFAPRPLQKTLIAVANQPGLYIVEAPMGMGKTEAALAVAYRRWTEGDEKGLYFALPTQLTSNRIHHRVSAFLDQVIEDESIQILAHGNAWLREDRILRFSPAHTTRSESDATEVCRWFTSSRRPLLAPFGTGTIDQALMSCIGAKHSALRLFALSGKVIVIDEVHSYDPYTSALVDQLVCWLLEVHCTVIVLSATLTAKRRREMIEKCGAVEPSSPPCNYPLITKVVAKTVTHHRIDDPAATESTICLKSFDTANSTLMDQIAQAAELGACVLVIRNTVALAQKTYRELKSTLHDDTIPIGLLHSRFPHFQREENEKHWMDCLGKDSSLRPSGCVLVATQVVEQSVDIDADLLVTDLAPTDLLLQRLGRLHRHIRQRPAGYEQATCWILQPKVDWSSDPKTIKQAIGPSAFVYPPIALYYAQQIWSSRETVTLPADIRQLLESSDDLQKSLPAGASILCQEFEAHTSAMIDKALRQGPFDQPTLQDTEGAQTRYNMQPSALLVLLREAPRQHGCDICVNPLKGNPQIVTPGYFHYDLAKILHENAVRIPAWLVRGSFGKQPDWLNQHINDAVLAVCVENSTKLEIIGGDSLSHQLYFHPTQGIHYEKITKPSATTDHQDEDFWF